MFADAKTASTDLEPIDGRFLPADHGLEIPTGEASRLLWFIYPEEFDDYLAGSISGPELAERAETRERRVRAAYRRDPP